MRHPAGFANGDVFDLNVDGGVAIVSEKKLIGEFWIIADVKHAAGLTCPLAICSGGHISLGAAEAARARGARFPLTRIDIPWWALAIAKWLRSEPAASRLCQCGSRKERQSDTSQA